MRQGQRGWILIDVLVATVVLAVALTALAYGLRAAVQGAGAASNRTTAAYLAQQQLSVLRQHDRKGHAGGDPVWTTSQSYLDPNSGITFACSTAVLPPGEVPPAVSGDAAIIPVRSIVRWTDAGGAQTFSVVTYYSQ